jgi:hypothetical protein
VVGIADTVSETTGVAVGVSGAVLAGTVITGVVVGMTDIVSETTGVAVGVSGAVLAGTVITGVGEGVTSTVPCTICGTGVAMGAAFVEAELMHPLRKTTPVTRTIKMPIAFHFFIARASKYPDT